MVAALYRRYRPESFAEMIGQQQVTEPLMTALRTGRINHAYLFSGPRGCGKTSSARILARCLNCAEGPTPTPCGECASCRELGRDGGGSLDVVEIDAASHGGVDDARELRERAVTVPARDRFKIFIIDEAHMVTPQGFNALLKVVEEPPEHVMFVFATTEPEKVIGTIRSRTHHFPFRLIPPATMLVYVGELCEAENVTAEAGVLPLVVRAGGGSARDTLSLLDQLIAGTDGAQIQYELASQLLGFTAQGLLESTVRAFADGDAAGAIESVDAVIQSGQDPRRFVEDLLERIRDLIVVKATGEGARAVLRGVTDDELAGLVDAAARFSPAALTAIADTVNTTLTEMVGVTSPRVQLELMVARILVAMRAEFAGGGAPAGQQDARGAAAPVAQAAPERDAAPARSASAQRPAAPEPPTAPGPGERSGERAGAPPSERPGLAPAPASEAAPAEEPGAAAARAASAWASAVPGGAPSTGSAESSDDRSERAGTASPSAPAAPAAPAEPVRPEPAAAGPAASGPAASGRGTADPAGSAAEGPGAAGPPAPAAPQGEIDLRRVRDSWPGVLEAVQRIGGRAAWAVVRQLEPIEWFGGENLRIEIPNPGVRDQFVAGRDRGKSPADHLKGALQQTFGMEVRIYPRVRTGPDGGAAPAAAPAPADDSEVHRGGPSWNVAKIPAGAAEDGPGSGWDELASPRDGGADARAGAGGGEGAAGAEAPARGADGDAADGPGTRTPAPTTDGATGGAPTGGRASERPVEPTAPTPAPSAPERSLEEIAAAEAAARERDTAPAPMPPTPTVAADPELAAEVRNPVAERRPSADAPAPADEPGSGPAPAPGRAGRPAGERPAGEQPVAERPTAAPSKPALHRPAPPAAAPDAAGASDASGRPAGGGISWTVAPVGGEPAAPAAPAVPDELRTAVADEPAQPWHPTHADGTERYGEAVVRERLSARFVGETPRDDEPELPAVPPPGGGAFDPDAPNDADAPDDYEAPPEE